MLSSVTVAAMGETYRIDLSALGGDAARAAAEAWADAMVSTEIGMPAATVVADGTLPTAEMLTELSRRITLTAIQKTRGRRWMLHAAGLAADDGRVVVLIGPSGRGKTTAARALGRRFGYVTDETVAVDESGRVHPYRKPLSIIEDGILCPKTERAPSALGLRPLPERRLRIGAIVLLTRRPDGPVRPLVENIELTDALPEVVSQTSYLADLHRPLQTLVAHAFSVGGIRRVSYREAETLSDAIEEILGTDLPAGRQGGTTADSHAVSAALNAGIARSRHAHGDGLERFSRTPVTDCIELEDPDRLVLLHPTSSGQGTVRVLTGLGPRIWLSARDATIPEITEAVIRTYGSAPGVDAAAAVAAAVRDMCDQGLLAPSDSGA